MTTRLLLAALPWLVPGFAAADAVVVTRAMTATTILEVFVDDDAIVVDLEVGGGDLAAMPRLIAAATEATSFPAALPGSAELSFTASGRRLTGVVEQVERRKRVERDEVSGEPLPSPSDEEVLFVKLRYPLGTHPRRLVLNPPKTEDGYAAADIGFVLYHGGIAVNDFRYLATSEPVDLDWRDPFYSRFERRTLNRKYGSPMNIFLYVEPFEVRKEFVVRPLDLVRFMDLELEPHEPIPADRRQEILDEVAEFLKGRAPVTVDGRQPEPILDRIHFLKRGLRMTRVVSPDEPIDGTNAIIGAIFVYPVDGIPQDVRLSWDMFDDRIARVPGSATDEAGPMPYFLTPDDSELHWVNYLKGGTLPGQLEVATPVAHVSFPVAFVMAVLLAIGFVAAGFRRRSWKFGLLALAVLVGGWHAPGGRSFEVAVPTSVRTPSGDDARPTIHALLYNVYRALDFRQEEVVFDRLAQSLSGDVLERVYLEMRRGLRLESQGGARVRVREVDILDVVPEEADATNNLRYRTRWNATGSVGHWGHTHMRTNQYDASVTLGRSDGRWKIADIDIIEEQRVMAGPRERPVERSP